MTDLTYEQRLERLDTMIAEGRLRRHEWTGKDDSGRETACLLVALSPEAGEAVSASACPAEVMPAWLAHITPDINDCVSDDAWGGIVREYAALAHRWHALTDEQWRRLGYRCRAIAVREALSHAPTGDHVPAVEGVLTLLDRAATGDYPTGKEWAARAAEAADAAWAPRAPRAAWAADAAAWAAGDRFGAAAAWAAAEAASRAMAWDRMATAMLAAIRAEIAGGQPCKS